MSMFHWSLSKQILQVGVDFILSVSFLLSLQKYSLTLSSFASSKPNGVQQQRKRNPSYTLSGCLKVTQESRIGIGKAMKIYNY